METSSCLNCGKTILYYPKRQTGKYCNNKCQCDYQYKERVSQWIGGSVTPGVKLLRRYLTEQQEGCYTCGINLWCNNPITLELDHIDGNSLNNSPDNLRMLCPNCHSQTPTYKNKNKGNGRVARRERAKIDYYRQRP